MLDLSDVMTVMLFSQFYQWLFLPNTLYLRIIVNVILFIPSEEPALRINSNVKSIWLYQV